MTEENPKTPAKANEPQTAEAETQPPAEKPKDLVMSPARWLTLLVLLAGLVGTGYLWLERPRTLASRSDDFTPDVMIVQLNDTYRVDAVAGGRLGGFGRVATFVKQTKGRGVPTLIVHAGDFIAPSLESRFFRGQQVIDALNYLQRLAPLYVVPGNHEFDEDDPAMVVDAIERSDFQWLASNLRLDPRGRAMSKRIAEHAIVPVGRLRLGIFALTLHGDHRGGDQPYAPVGFEERYAINEQALDAMKQDVPGPIVAALGQLKGKEFTSRGDFLAALSQVTKVTDQEFLSAIADYASEGYVGIAERQIEQLEGEGADAIIGLTHLNMPDDRQIAQLRRRHPRFVWIAGGHEHYAQRERLTAAGALITKGDSNARSIWCVAIGLKDGAPQLREEKVELDERYNPDEGYQRDIVADYHAKLSQKLAYLDRTIGDTRTVGQECCDATEETVRNKSSDWGSFLADQMRKAYSNEEAQIGFLNGGGIRIDDQFSGQLRFEQLERTFGFETKVVYVKLSGADLKRDILEHAVGGKRGDGRFLQSAGISFDFNRLRPPGDRTFNIRVRKGAGWEDFKEGEDYKIAVPEYLFNCGDGYKFREKIKAYIPPGPDLRALVYKALNQVNRGAKSTAPAAEEGALEVPDYFRDLTARDGEWLSGEGNNICQP
jgi:2',3'-cyclic-nucleotide 2'-phosphodiesterase (5'-nucleotidase family)